MDCVFMKGAQSVASEIKIRWDGDIPGVQEHRLSIGAFGEALFQLVLALRRIATQMVTSAVDPADRPSTGRFANLARGLDIEISEIKGGSSGFDGTVTFMQPPDFLPLFEDLPQRAAFELLDSIEREGKGQPSNWAVHKFLTLLPPGLHHQVYEYTNGASSKRVELGDVKLAEVPEEYPFLRELGGDVVGVGFEPGRSEVRIKGDGPTIVCDADEAQVETALQLRHQPVRCLGVHAGKHTRLLRITKASEPGFTATPEMLEEHIFKRWSGLFARLAK